MFNSKTKALEEIVRALLEEVKELRTEVEVLKRKVRSNAKPSSKK